MFDLFQAMPRNEHLTHLGEKRIGEGKVAALLLAGGQGTRLGSRYLSKGFYPIGLLSKRSLFAIFAGKVRSASRKWQRALPLAIMTSPLNHEAIVSYFAENGNFGLLESQLHFFQQSLLPFLDEQERQLPEKGPSGNGVAILELFRSGIAAKWEEQGVAYFTTILVDNPLADPFSACLAGFHAERDLSAITTRRRDVEEKVGVYVVDEGRVKVCEYMECPPAEWPRHSYANLSQFMFSMAFAKEQAQTTLPLHKVKKDNYLKCEYFITDFVEKAEDFGALEMPRELVFAPLKNSSGPDSIVTVQEALQRRDRLQWQELFSLDPGAISFELGPDFYYPDEGLLKQYAWQKPPENSYIE